MAVASGGGMGVRTSFPTDSRRGREGGERRLRVGGGKGRGAKRGKGGVRKERERRGVAERGGGMRPSAGPPPAQQERDARVTAEDTRPDRTAIPDQPPHPAGPRTNRPRCQPPERREPVPVRT